MLAKTLKILLLLGLTIGLHACAGTSPPTRYYLLNPIPSSDTDPSVDAPQTLPSLGIGPVSLPDYLDRPQIVTRRNPNTLYLADFDRWAESLQPMFIRVLRENLIALGAADKVVVFPWPSNTAFEYQMTADVLRFDAVDSKNAILTVRWAILRFEDRNLLHQKESVYSRSVEGSDYSDLVRSLNRLLEDFSREVAVALDRAYRQDHGW